MKVHVAEQAWGLARRFALGGYVVDVQRYGSGLINDTYLVTTDSHRRGILQRINDEVFPAPERVQRNLRTLLDHVGRKLNGADRHLHLPAIVPTRDGEDFVSGAEGFWRMSSFIEGSETFDALTDEFQAREIGRALGCFHALVDDLDPDLLHDTLPGFHVTPGYLQRWDRVLTENTGRGLVDLALRPNLEFIEDRRGWVGVLEEAKQCGLIRTRVIHGDPKLNNVLFDVGNGKALSLIDLDTVKPGLIHYDLGDCLRSCCNRAGELGQDGEGVHFDVSMCRAVLEGYFAEVGASLTRQDVALLFDAIRLIPFELGLRFLTDHLRGDVYFKVTEPGQNLRRASIQFDLVRSIEHQEAAIRAIAADVFIGQKGSDDV